MRDALQPIQFRMRSVGQQQPKSIALDVFQAMIETNHILGAERNTSEARGHEFHS
jgi:hypothetical protein